MPDFFQTKYRAPVIFIVATLTTALFTFCTHLCALHVPEWYGLLVGGALTLLAIPFHLLGSRSSPAYLLPFLLNTAGMGFCAGAYYTTSGVCAAYSHLFPVTVIPLALVLILALFLIALPQHKEPIVAVFIILEIGLIITAGVFWGIRGGDFYAFALFSLAISLFYTAVCALTVGEPERRFARDISFGSFGAFLLVGAVALIAVVAVAGGDGCDCDCDCSDGCDCSGCDCGGSGDKKQRKK